MATTAFSELRRELGVSQRKFAALFGVTPRTIQLWESGAHEVPVSAQKLLETAQCVFRVSAEIDATDSIQIFPRGKKGTK